MKIIGHAYVSRTHSFKSLGRPGQASALLEETEKEVPIRVIQAIEFLASRGLWFVISRNASRSPVTSCREAASRRQRLGTAGIPLGDELKSYFVVYYTHDGRRRYAVLHSRAHLRFDPSATRRILCSDRPIARLSTEELARVFRCDYGTVTPFSEGQPPDFVHVFDESLLKLHTPPHTMMTNAGDRTWAVEFDPEALISSFLETDPESALVGDITHKNKREGLDRICFGVITGNGPESGINLWRNMNRLVRESRGTEGYGDVDYPRVILHSIPEMGLSMELEARADEVWFYLEKGIVSLCQSGATHLALACHTTHCFQDRIRSICSREGCEFVSMSKSVIDYIDKQELSELTVVGIPYVADLGKKSPYRPLANRAYGLSETLHPKSITLGYWIKKVSNDARGINMLRDILRRGARGTYVLVALTEISVLLDGHYSKKSRSGESQLEDAQLAFSGHILVDPLRIYARTLADIHLGCIESLARESGEGLQEGDLQFEEDGLEEKRKGK